MKRYNALLIAAALVIMGSAAFSADVWVDVNAPGPTYDGTTLMTAFLTIQEGIDAAADGDTVLVNDGVYFGAGNTNLSFAGKAIRLRSLKGSHLTAIDIQGTGAGITFTMGETAEAMLEGFTLIGGGGADGVVEVTGGGSPTIADLVIRNANVTGAPIYCVNSTPHITRNQIYDCTGGLAGAIYMEQCTAPDLVISSNVIYNNQSTTNGGAISLVDSGVTVINNTIAGNTAAANGGGIDYDSSTLNGIVNTILWDNQAPTGPEVAVRNASTMAIDDSIVMGGESSIDVSGGSGVTVGPNLIDADPMFVDRANGDFHIVFDSPARKAGDRHHPLLPASDFEGDEIIGLFVLPEIGADEFATRFYVTGEPATGNTITLKIVGWPNTSPVVLIRGEKIQKDPIETPYGDLWLRGRITELFQFNPIPDNGVRIVEHTVTSALPPGTEIPMQVLVGTQLSNLFTVRFVP